jgi:endonuclease/exonuclease/phosphatase family metal-dependent hydrolase
MGDCLKAIFKSITILSLISMLPFTTVEAKQFKPTEDDKLLRVMTRNVYHGVTEEFNALLTPGGDLYYEVGEVYNGYFERDFNERAKVLVQEIQETQPDLIGLQEAILVRTQFPPDGPATPATDVVFDYVEILLYELAQIGLQYEVASQSIGFDAELPGYVDATIKDVRHTDREVILVRADSKGSNLKILNTQEGHFLANCFINSPDLGTVTISRGWAAVDVKYRGNYFRFVSTHLDGDCLPVTHYFQVTQASEIIAGPGAAEIPIILVGDMNSPADGSGTATYGNFISAGYTDAWSEVSTDDGYTYGQQDDLTNYNSQLNQRIDLVLFDGPWKVKTVENVGDETTEIDSLGIWWPSDHAGVVATLEFLEP